MDSLAGSLPRQQQEPPVSPPIAAGASSSRTHTGREAAVGAATRPDATLYRAPQPRQTKSSRDAAESEPPRLEGAAAGQRVDEREPGAGAAGAARRPRVARGGAHGGGGGAQDGQRRADGSAHRLPRGERRERRAGGGRALGARRGARARAARARRGDGGGGRGARRGARGAARGRGGREGGGGGAAGAAGAAGARRGGGRPARAHAAAPALGRGAEPRRRRARVPIAPPQVPPSPPLPHGAAARAARGAPAGRVARARRPRRPRAAALVAPRRVAHGASDGGVGASRPATERARPSASGGRGARRGAPAASRARAAGVGGPARGGGRAARRGGGGARGRGADGARRPPQAPQALRGALRAWVEHRAKQLRAEPELEAVVAIWLPRLACACALRRLRRRVRTIHVLKEERREARRGRASVLLRRWWRRVDAVAARRFAALDVVAASERAGARRALRSWNGQTARAAAVRASFVRATAGKLDAALALWMGQCQARRAVAETFAVAAEACTEVRAVAARRWWRGARPRLRRARQRHARALAFCFRSLERKIWRAWYGLVRRSRKTVELRGLKERQSRMLIKGDAFRALQGFAAARRRAGAVAAAIEEMAGRAPLRRGFDAFRARARWGRALGQRAARRPPPPPPPAACGPPAVVARLQRRPAQSRRRRARVIGRARRTARAVAQVERRGGGRVRRPRRPRALAADAARRRARRARRAARRRRRRSRANSRSARRRTRRSAPPPGRATPSVGGSRRSLRR